MNDRKLRGTTLTALLIAGLALEPAFAATHMATTHKKRPPVVTVARMSGQFAHGYPRLTQHAFVQQKCVNAMLGSTDTNGQTASLVPVGKYARDVLTVKFTPDTSTPLEPLASVWFYDASCNHIDTAVPKTTNGQFSLQVDKLTQVGTIPTGAKWLMLQGAQADTEYLAQPKSVRWALTIKTPSTRDLRPTALKIDPSGPLG